ncbi:TetR/AcrR family transcriptional regulator [Ralstonia syzygii subsp. celebesensis]
MAKRAEAPLGSTYHHFPGGKQQVVVEAVKFAGARVGAGLDHHLKAGAVAGLRGFLAMWRDILVRSDFRIGCPVMATAVDEPIDDLAEEALAAAAAVFSDWQRKLVASLEAQGRDRASASRLATLIIASVEGPSCCAALNGASRRSTRSQNSSKRLSRTHDGSTPVVCGASRKPRRSAGCAFPQIKMRVHGNSGCYKSPDPQRQAAAPRLEPSFPETAKPGSGLEKNRLWKHTQIHRCRIPASRSPIRHVHPAMHGRRWPGRRSGMRWTVSTC